MEYEYCPYDMNHMILINKGIGLGSNEAEVSVRVSLISGDWIFR